jgi:hypothetical protein
MVRCVLDKSFAAKLCESVKRGSKIHSVFIVLNFLVYQFLKLSESLFLHCRPGAFSSVGCADLSAILRCLL